ncbi:uncharacterized protein LOC143036063 [Oratosquilla oratoria]|uniref:uncharacterized protein LOC143036063 n=1 Tax=Oratosquilla oratoria TaxID=337810 RepID=UPI003F76A7CC
MLSTKKMSSTMKPSLIWGIVFITHLAQADAKVRTSSGGSGRSIEPLQSLSLGGDCAVDADCFAKGSHCVKGVCTCMPYHLQVNNSLCLPGVLLGFKCWYDAQCSLRVEGSGCIQGFCRCSIGYISYRRNNCLKGSSVGQMCRSHDQCRITSTYSYCDFTVPRVYGRCRCQDGFKKRGALCGEETYSLGSPCKTTAQCSSDVPTSVCAIIDPSNSWEYRRISAVPAASRDRERLLRAKEDFELNAVNGVLPVTKVGSPTGAVCACVSGQIASEDQKRCIPVLKDIGPQAASLGQRCSSTSECELADRFSVCRDGVCDCVVPSSKCSRQHTGCYNDTFQCASDGKCISWFYVCNGVRECADGSDEEVCLPNRCSPLAITCRDGTCVSRGQVCDGVTHCPDGSDELGCKNKTASCPPSAYRCLDGRCLPAFAFCNATPTCSDGSDEPEDACIQGALNVKHCPFRCRNGRCRSSAILCSGEDGCGDNSDEEKCQVCSCPSA